MRVFLSYSRHDHDHVAGLVQVLSDLNVDVFQDTKDMQWGQEIASRVRRAIGECDALIVVISPASLKSQWVWYEVGAAQTLGKAVLPYLTHLAMDVPDYLRGLHAVATPHDARVYLSDSSWSGVARPAASRSAQGVSSGTGTDQQAPTVVMGDRRENPPETPGDFFAASASPRDITWLPNIGLPKGSLIWNDKVVCATADDLDVPQTVRDRDLIIAGSPYCNLMARMINQSAFFRFKLDRAVLQEIGIWEDQIRGLPRHSQKLRDLRTRIGARHDWLVMHLRGKGFVEPIDQQDDVGIYAGKDHDYALVTLCAHPYSKTRRAILVAGLHLPGTMRALKMLADPSLFLDHPAGGIVKVTIPDGGWYERLLNSSVEWFTPKYDWDQLQMGVGRTSKLFKNGEIDESEVQGYRRLREDLADDTLGQVLGRMLLRGSVGA
jgi:hypothetical protein